MTEQSLAAQPEGLSASTLEAVVVGGDLARLSPTQRLEYYSARCRAAGLDPAAQPFQYINLNGKLTLYASKGCTDQLSRVHGVKVSIVNQGTDSGMRVVHVRAETKDGRATDEIGAVNVEGLKGEALANAMMKAVTKAKRRAILSMCGLGMLDETETETIPGARPGNLEQLHAAADPFWDGPNAHAPVVSANTPAQEAHPSSTGPRPDRTIRGVPITSGESWGTVKGLQIKGKGPYAKLTWGEVDTTKVDSPFAQWIDKVADEAEAHFNRISPTERKPGTSILPAYQRALIAWDRLETIRAGTNEALCPLTQEEMDEADRRADERAAAREVGQ